MNDNVPLVGQIKLAPPAIVMQNGQQFAFPQVVTAEMSMGLVDLLVTRIRDEVLAAIRAEFDLFPKVEDR